MAIASITPGKEGEYPRLDLFTFVIPSPASVPAAATAAAPTFASFIPVELALPVVPTAATASAPTAVPASPAAAPVVVVVVERARRAAIAAVGRRSWLVVRHIVACAVVLVTAARRRRAGIGLFCSSFKVLLTKKWQ